jgi:RHS repeat-associated protein
MTGSTLAYAGQHWDQDAGLSYAQQRWYDPRTGRFLSEDPVGWNSERLGQPARGHAFGYGNANPMRFTDPLGLDAGDWDIGMLFWRLISSPRVNGSDPQTKQVDAAVRGFEQTEPGKALKGATRGFVVTSATATACMVPYAGPLMCRAAAGVAGAGLFTSGAPTLRGLEHQVGGCMPSSFDVEVCSETAVYVGAGALAGRMSAAPTQPSAGQLEFEFMRTLPRQRAPGAAGLAAGADAGTAGALGASGQLELKLRVPTGSPEALSALRDSVRERAAEMVEMLSRRERGPVLTGVLDKDSGELFFGINQERVPADLHPLLKEHYDRLMATTGGQTPVKAGIPGAHSEIVALNKALRAREAATGRAVTADDLSGFAIHNRSLLKNKVEGVPPLCDNCQAIVPPGVEVVP